MILKTLYFAVIAAILYMLAGCETVKPENCVWCRGTGFGTWHSEITLIGLLIFAIAIIVLDYFSKEDLSGKKVG